MKRTGIALRTFFRVLRDPEFTEQVRQLMNAKVLPATGEAPSGPVTRRSDALSLLAALQREARLVDFVMEPLNGYSDVQIGAAARDVHRDAGKVIKRIFGLEPLNTEGEGASLQVSNGFDPTEFKLTGRVSGKPPYTGKLCHHGWKATACDVPTWTGSETTAMVVAPAEVEVQ